MKRSRDLGCPSHGAASSLGRHLAAIAGPEYDIVGGGITILDSRTRNAAGEEVVSFTSGHVRLRQSLLVRAQDAERIASHADLTSDMRVGVLADTTGERRLLELTGQVDADGVFVAGTRIETAAGTLTADGSANYTIDFAAESPGLDGRRLPVPAIGRHAPGSLSR